MNIHYFQRYHQKENVATANTMLLLSRLYQYSSHLFYKLLSNEFFANNFDTEVRFAMQEKAKNSVPDATITQESFKLVIETKTSDWFGVDQLIRHTNSFGDEKHKVLITLAPVLMNQDRKNEFESKLAELNKVSGNPISHINLTFEKLIDVFQDVIGERDYDMQDMLEDYISYCRDSKLLQEKQGWKYLRVQLAGKTMDFNVQEGLYYDNINRGFRPHKYLGLYKDKAVRAVGEVKQIITAVKNDEGVYLYTAEKGEVTELAKEKIQKAIDDGVSRGYNLVKNRYFIVDKFHETFFEKITLRAPMGTRIFNLEELLGADSNSTVEEIAEKLRNITWA